MIVFHIFSHMQYRMPTFLCYSLCVCVFVCCMWMPALLKWKSMIFHRVNVCFACLAAEVIVLAHLWRSSDPNFGLAYKWATSRQCPIWMKFDAQHCAAPYGFGCWEVLHGNWTSKKSGYCKNNRLKVSQKFITVWIRVTDHALNLPIDDQSDQ